MLRHPAENNESGQVAINMELAKRLSKCGGEMIAVTSIAGQFCSEIFQEISPIPFIDLLETVKTKMNHCSLKKKSVCWTHTGAWDRHLTVCSMALKGCHLWPG